MDPNISAQPTTPPQEIQVPSSSSSKTKWAIIALVSIFLVLVSIGGAFYLGRNIRVGLVNKNGNGFTRNSQNNITSVSLTPKYSPTVSPIQPSASSNQWSQIQYEFMQGYAFDIKYPSDAETLVFNGTQSGLPVDPIEQIFSKAIEFSSPPFNSKDNYSIAVGVSDIDPSLCYQTSCQHTLTTIMKNETASVSGILSKKLEATIENGMLSPTKVSLYIIPYLDKFIILYSKMNDTKIFNEMVSSFKLMKY